MKVKDVLLADVAKRSAVSGVTVNFLLNGQVKQRRRRQQRERQKSNRFRLAKQQLCTSHAFCVHLLPSLHDYNVKVPNFTFCLTFS